jgi:hypothetical protein
MNQFSKEYLVVAQNASGRNMNVPLYRFKGKSPGPKVYIQSSIHGAEVQNTKSHNMGYNLAASIFLNYYSVKVRNIISRIIWLRENQNG